MTSRHSGKAQITLYAAHANASRQLYYYALTSRSNVPSLSDAARALLVRKSNDVACRRERHDRPICISRIATRCDTVLDHRLLCRCSMSMSEPAASSLSPFVQPSRAITRYHHRLRSGSTTRKLLLSRFVPALFVFAC